MSKAKAKPKPRSAAPRPRLAERLTAGLDEVRRFLEGEDNGVRVIRVKVPSHVVAVRELTAAREKAGLSVAAVAAAVGVPADKINRLEAGKVKRPTVELLEKYATAVGWELKLVVKSPSLTK